MACEPKQRSQPIAGWLVLPALGLMIGPALSVAQIGASWQVLNNQIIRRGVPYGPEWEKVVACELGLNVLFLGLLHYVAVLFFRKKKATPRAFVLLMCAHVGYVLLDDFVLAAIVNLKPDGFTILKSLVLCSIWISYFFVSKRVEETFVFD